LTLEIAQAQLDDREYDAVPAQLQQAMDALNATTRDIRNYILDLRPRRFQGDNIVVALERLLAEFKANTLMEVTLTAQDEADRALTPEARVALFHIAQEALSNTVKHSRASRVEVSLAREDGEIVLTVRDNGGGVDVNRVEQRLGHGLANMRDRAQSLGGTFTLRAAPDGGAEARVVLPVRSAQSPDAP
jgi:signal transduction histidine kinase